MQAQDVEAIYQNGEFTAEIVPAPLKSLTNTVLLQKSGDTYEVALEDIRVYPDLNSRVKDESYEAHITFLMTSIKENGFFRDKPLAGFGAYDGKKPVLYLVDGHCRFEALTRLRDEGYEMDYVPLVVKDKSQSVEDLLLSMIASNEHKTFTTLEKALMCKKLRRLGLSSEVIAERLGLTKVRIEQMLQVVGSPASIRKLLEEGQVPFNVALDAIRTHKGDAPAVIQEALKTAKAAGQTKLTERFMPDAIRMSACKKQAPDMYKAIEGVRGHKAYKSLPKDLVELIEGIVGAVAKAEEKAAAKAEKVKAQAEDDDSAKQGDAGTGE